MIAAGDGGAPNLTDPAATRKNLRRGSFTIAVPSSAFSLDHLVGAGELRSYHFQFVKPAYGFSANTPRRSLGPTHLAGAYTGRILNGEKAADLPNSRRFATIAKDGPMPSGSQKGEHRGGRKRGTPNL
jgi:hypothetical protein